MKNTFFLVLFFSFISCSNVDKDIIVAVKNFPSEIQLNYSVIETPGVLYNLGNIFITDSFVITIDLSADTILRVFNLPEITYKNGYIHRGKGPSEELAIDPFAQVIDKSRIVYKSLTNVKIIEITNNQVIVNKTIKLPGELFNLSHILLLNENFIFGWIWNQNNKKEFIAYLPFENRSIEFGPNFPSMSTKVPNGKNSAVFSKVSALKPDKTMFASAYDKIKLIRIYKNDGSLFKEIRFKNQTKVPEELIKDGSVVNLENLTTFYQRINSTNKYIYALYSGKTLGEISNADNANADFCQEIHVYDWNGNPIVKFKLNKLCSIFAVSPKNDFLICYSLMNADKLYKFDITPYLK